MPRRLVIRSSQTLEQRIEEAQALLRSLNGRRDFAGRMSRRSMEHHLGDLRRQLRLAQEEEEGSYLKRDAS